MKSEHHVVGSSLSPSRENLHTSISAVKLQLYPDVRLVMSAVQDAKKQHNKSSKSGHTVENAREYTSFLDAEGWSWSRPRSWPLSIKFLPLVVALIPVYIGAQFRNSFVDTCVVDFDYGFDINAVQRQVQAIERSWEVGIASQALLEYKDPHLSVFTREPFPGGKLPRPGWIFADEASKFVERNVKLDDEGRPALLYNSTDVSRMASLGVSALLLGGSRPDWQDAAIKLKDYIMNETPRSRNGAIMIEDFDGTHQIRGDTIGSISPFLAYCGFVQSNGTLMREAVKQCEWHKEVLGPGNIVGLWQSSTPPDYTIDKSVLVLRSALAAYGMLRTRATLVATHHDSQAMKRDVNHLEELIMGIIEGAMDYPASIPGSIEDWTRFEWRSGTAMMAAAAYRLGAIMGKSSERDKIVDWAKHRKNDVLRSLNSNRESRAETTDSDHGLHHGHGPESHSNVLIMAAAWRDCVCAKICMPDG